MRIQRISQPNVLEAVSGKICRDIETALNSITTIDDNFVVNDSSWYMSKKGGTKANLCVMNAANYISKTFQKKIEDLGWEIEKTLGGQTIDGYCEVAIETVGYSISRDNFINLIRDYWELYPDSSIDLDFSRFYQIYLARNFFSIADITPQLHNYFESHPIQSIVKVGLEFETGNIASSFRALLKLNTLYRDGYVDVGVFIAAHDKQNTAARIWPSSNRVGSFEELRNRNYKKYNLIPLWEFSFQPDAYSKDAPYLQGNGGLYKPVRIDERITIDNIAYKIYERPHKGDKVLQPIND